MRLQFKPTAPITPGDTPQCYRSQIQIAAACSWECLLVLLSHVIAASLTLRQNFWLSNIGIRGEAAQQRSNLQEQTSADEVLANLERALC